jgi:hypothetical protein
MVKICMMKLLIKSTQVLQHPVISSYILKGRLLLYYKEQSFKLFKEIYPFFWEAK